MEAKAKSLNLELKHSEFGGGGYGIFMDPSLTGIQRGQLFKYDGKPYRLPIKKLLPDGTAGEKAEVDFHRNHVMMDFDNEGNRPPSCHLIPTSIRGDSVVFFQDELRTWSELVGKGYRMDTAYPGAPFTPISHPYHPRLPSSFASLLRSPPPLPSNPSFPPAPSCADEMIDSDGDSVMVIGDR